MKRFDDYHFLHVTLLTYLRKKGWGEARRKVQTEGVEGGDELGDRVESNWDLLGDEVPTLLLTSPGRALGGSELGAIYTLSSVDP